MSADEGIPSLFPPQAWKILENFLTRWSKPQAKSRPKHKFSWEKVASNRSLPDKLFRCDSGIVPAETEGIVHHRVNFELPRGIGHVIQIAFWIRCFVIYCRRNGVGLNGFGASSHFDSTCGA